MHPTGHQTVINCSAALVRRSSMACRIRWPWGMLILILSLSREHGVRALTFAYNGFHQSDVHIVLDSPWLLDTTGGYNSFYLDNPGVYVGWSVAGRFLYPGLVEMIDPSTATVKSWSTTFIYQIQIGASNGATGPGMAFIIVPDNVTIGAPLDYMGVITVNTTAIDKNSESDNYTLAVELDTYQNSEFDDPNENHIGVDLASMNSYEYTYKPTFNLASPSTDVFQQIWIDYYQNNSRLEIYVAFQDQGKPATPQAKWDGMDLSLLKRNMYIGFAGAAGHESNNYNIIYAWSFSNDGHLAPDIYLAPQAPPPPPPAPRSSKPPPPVAPPPPPVFAPAPGSSPPPIQESPPPLVPSPLPPTPILSPPPSTSPPLSVPTSPPVNAPPPPPLSAPTPPPLNAPTPPPLGAAPPPPESPAPEYSRNSHASSTAGKLAGEIIGGLVSIVILGGILYKLGTAVARPLRFFISHTGGENQEGKNFPDFLCDGLTKSWKLKFFIEVFTDRTKLQDALPFPPQILQELERTEVGIVLVTPDFFTRKWPMVELVAFVEYYDGRLNNMQRVLPLYYRMTVDQVRDNLRRGVWERYWTEMSTQGNHPLEVERCRHAVERLCDFKGVNYIASDRGRDKEYIREIRKSVGRIVFKEMWNR